MPNVSFTTALTLAGVATLTLIATATAHAAGSCKRTKYGVHCVSSTGAYPAVLNIRYGTPPSANKVTARNGWLDGSNDGGRTWKKLAQGPYERFAYHLWRTCAWKTFSGFQCTPWAN